MKLVKINVKSVTFFTVHTKIVAKLINNLFREQQISKLKSHFNFIHKTNILDAFNTAFN